MRILVSSICFANRNRPYVKIYRFYNKQLSTLFKLFTKKHTKFDLISHLFSLYYT